MEWIGSEPLLQFRAVVAMAKVDEAGVGIVQFTREDPGNGRSFAKPFAKRVGLVESDHFSRGDVDQLHNVTLKIVDRRIDCIARLDGDGRQMPSVKGMPGTRR